MIRSFLTRLIRIGIRFYQGILSPMLKFASGPSGGCRFTPSCSNYFLQAVEIHGPFRGSWQGVCRIFRCHPWGGSGYDPVALPRNQPNPPTACNCGHPRH